MEDLTAFAEHQQTQFNSSTLPAERKEHGHFGTPARISELMAGMFSEIPPGPVRILDPGAGVGMLSAAVCDRIVRQRVPRSVTFELWENDPRLERFMRTTMERCRRVLEEAGHCMEYQIRTEDFILANSGRSLFRDGSTASFHLAILNPPYFKLRKDCEQARAMGHVVHGQPNIYVLFMAVAADLLLPGGEMVAITPRSYFNGSYFRRFRKWFFDRMAARRIHVFESRTEAFRNDNVLQENVILKAEKHGQPREVVLSTSNGRDWNGCSTSNFDYSHVIDDAQGDHVVRVATSPVDREIVPALDDLPKRFNEQGFRISTGPVVTFRSTEFLRHERGKNTAPLLWMHNVRPFVTRFPPRNGKPAHIAVTDGSRRLLVPATRYILLKRFTAKEEKRRLVAGIVEASDSYSEWIGLENHLNYVYRPGAELTETEAFGLAAFFNSVLVDRYFRVISGNTQVNATEIRAIPVPDERALERIGEEIQRTSERDACSVERIVGSVLRLPGNLVEKLCEEAG